MSVETHFSIEGQTFAGSQEELVSYMEEAGYRVVCRVPEVLEKEGGVVGDVTFVKAGLEEVYDITGCDNREKEEL